MKLRSIYLENFRSYKKINIKFKKIKFVILTGKNGSGKTNLLEAISFLLIETLDKLYQLKFSLSV